MNTQQPIRIAGAQGFYGDSPMAAMNIVMEGGADYLVHDALAELTLSILQKDRMADPNLGYARDIEFLATTLIPLAFKKGVKIVTNSGGLNPEGAARKVKAILEKQGIKGLKIAVITGDNFFGRLDELKAAGHELRNMDTNQPYAESTYMATHANVYTGAKTVADALAQGADLILAGRVADPCLTLGILVNHYGWKLDGDLSQADLDLLASGIAVGHLIECGGQASGGNSYAEWPMDYPIHNLGYPIAHVYADGSAVMTKLESQGGKVSRNTIREQLVYEIHDPANYLTPDVTVDLTGVQIEDIEPNKVSFKGVKGKPRPEQLKLTIGQMEGYVSDQFFYFSAPFAYDKALKFIDAVKQIWAGMPYLKIQRQEFSVIGLDAMHPGAAPAIAPEVLNSLNEIGVRLCIMHADEKTGKLALQSIVCLGLNGPPGTISIPGWGKPGRAMLSLWPTLVPRELVQDKVEVVTTEERVERSEEGK